jgi:hypothetical protein
MGVWEYGSMGVWELETLALKLISLIKNIKMRVVSSRFENDLFIPILPYSHTPILFLYSFLISAHTL